jgi:recombination protein RecT
MSTEKTTTAVSTVKQEMQKFEAQMKGYEDTIMKLVGSKYGVSADEFAISVMTAVKKSPKLLQCDRASLFAAVLVSAELKLRFNTPEGFAYVIPYGKDVQFQIGYKGLVEIAYRNPRVKSIYAGVVYNDEVEAGKFKYSRGLNLVLEHDPIMNRTPEQEKAKRVHCAYAVIKLEGADPIIEVLDGNQLNKIKSLSKAGSSGSSPYNNGTDVADWMFKKAAIKQALKTVPKQGVSEIARAVELDDKLSTGGRARMSDDNEVVIEEVEFVDMSEAKDDIIS